MSNEDYSAQKWYAEVVRICKQRGYCEWFYADREAWLEHYREGQSPEEAIDENYACLY